MTARERTRAVLAAVSSGADVELAMKLADGMQLDPPIVSTLLTKAPGDRRTKVADLAIAAMRPSAKRVEGSVYPMSLLLASIVLMLTAISMHKFVMPVFVKMTEDFGAASTVDDWFWVTILLAIAAAVLAVVSAVRVSGGEGRATAVLLFGGFRTAQVPAEEHVFRALKWLAASTAAGLPPTHVIEGARIVEVAAVGALQRHCVKAASALAAIRDWSSAQPKPVQNVAAGKIGAEDESSAITRVALAARSRVRSRDPGFALAIVGFVLVAIGVFLTVAPILTTTARLGSFVVGSVS